MHQSLLILNMAIRWQTLHLWPVPILSRRMRIYLDTKIHLWIVKRAYIHDSKDSEGVIVASDCISAPAYHDSSPLPPSSPDIWPSSSLPPVSRIASPGVDPDLRKESTAPGSDCIFVLDYDFSTSSDDWKRIDLGVMIHSPVYHTSIPVVRQ